MIYSCEQCQKLMTMESGCSCVFNKTILTEKDVGDYCASVKQMLDCVNDNTGNYVIQAKEPSSTYLVCHETTVKPYSVGDVKRASHFPYVSLAKLMLYIHGLNIWHWDIMCVGSDSVENKCIGDSI